VGDAGWDHDHIAGMQIDDGAAVAAKTYLSRAGDDAERFVRSAVVVVVGKKRRKKAGE
jgi:hypothetical protein